jgi:hypothetical protein
MAAVITSRRETRGGVRRVIVTIVESAAGTASEYQITPSTGPKIPTSGHIVCSKHTLISGTGVPGAKINPAFGLTTAFVVNTQAHVGTSLTTAAHIDDQARLYYSCLTGHDMWLRSSCSDATLDHVIHSTIIFEGA